MVRAQLCALMGSVLMLAATATEARELRFFVENRLAVDDNVFLSTSNAVDRPKTDGYWEVIPRAVLQENGKEVNYDVRYQPSYQQFFTESNVSGFDHNARGRIDWNVSPRDGFGVSGSYFNNRRVRLVFTDLPSGPVLPAEPNDGQRITRGQASAYYRRSITPALSVRADYALDDLGYTRRDFSDSRAQTGSVGVDYALSELTSIGTTVTGRYRNSRVNQLDVNRSVLREIRTLSRTFDVSLVLNQQLTPTVNASVRVGPSVIDTKQDAQFAGPQPVFPSGFAFLPTQKSYSNNLSVFATFTLQKQLRRGGHADFSYSRYESGGGGQVSSSIVDGVTFDLRYILDHDWDFRLSANWNQLKQVGNVSVVSNQKTTRYGVAVTVGYRIDKRLKLLGRARYRTQRQSLRNLRDPVTDVTSAFIALQYDFEPIVF